MAAGQARECCTSLFLKLLAWKLDHGHQDQLLGVTAMRLFLAHGAATKVRNGATSMTQDGLVLRVRLHGCADLQNGLGTCCDDLVRWCIAGGAPEQAAAVGLHLLACEVHSHDRTHLIDACFPDRNLVIGAAHRQSPEGTARVSGHDLAARMCCDGRAQEPDAAGSSDGLLAARCELPKSHTTPLLRRQVGDPAGHLGHRLLQCPVHRR
mmetsp:Transcript_31432/g.83706  ORF Transcript_31432/g.83706 Transcript_31432/m.83706 type:complete len:209 (+) Transcript_31432:654-1280(+)